MIVKQFSVTSEPLEIALVIQAVENTTAKSTIPTGAVASFLGLVREENLGRRVLHLEYEAYEPLAIKAFERISDEAGHKWPDVTLAVHHRLGRLTIGEISVAISAASPHRAESFSACRYTIERIKQIAPIWKHEFFVGGDVWIEGATANPDDEGAREDAYRLACT